MAGEDGRQLHRPRARLAAPFGPVGQGRLWGRGSVLTACRRPRPARPPAIWSDHSVYPSYSTSGLLLQPKPVGGGRGSAGRGWQAAANQIKARVAGIGCWPGCRQGVPPGAYQPVGQPQRQLHGGLHDTHTHKQPRCALPGFWPPRHGWRLPGSAPAPVHAPRQSSAYTRQLLASSGTL